MAKTTADQAIAAAARGDRKYNIALKFNKGRGEYGFDDPPEDATVKNVLDSYYQSLDNGSKIAWKSLASGTPDAISATVLNADLIPNKVEFTLNDSRVKSDVASGKEIPVTLNASGDGVEAELIASYNGSIDVIGKLNLVSYNNAPYHVVVVPVNSNKLPVTKEELESKLNSIYKQAVVEWSVTLEPTPLQVSLDATFDDGATTAISNYTNDMKKVINAYTKDHTLATDTYYLFLVGNAASGKTKLGYLPRKKQAGFIFVDNLTSSELTIKTIAHELGHGAFRLKHTFSEFPSITEGSTDNLMDYKSSGTHLYKYQWDYVHDPEAMIALFDDEEEGASKSLLNSKYVTIQDNLTDNAIKYGSNKKDDQFSQAAVTSADEKLELLFKADRTTYMYIAYIWIDQSVLDNYQSKNIDFQKKIQSTLNDSYNILKEQTQESNFNLLSIVNTKYAPDLRADQKNSEAFREKFYPMKRLNQSCIKLIDDYLNTSTKKKFVDGLDEALIERSEELLKALQNCDLLTNSYGDIIAETALAKDDDTRTYSQVSGSNRLIDDFIDCAEFAYEIATEMGFSTIPSGGCAEQVEWFKKNGTFVKEFSSVAVGDFIFWDRPVSKKIYPISAKNSFPGDEYSTLEVDSNGETVGFYLPYDHVGIVTEKLEDGSVRYINASLNRDRSTKQLRPSINAPNTPTDTSGTIWKGSVDNEQNFVGYGRLKEN